MLTGGQPINFIVYHITMVIQGGHSRVKDPVNYDIGACGGSIGDEGGSVLLEHDQ